MNNDFTYFFLKLCFHERPVDLKSRATLEFYSAEQKLTRSKRLPPHQKVEERQLKDMLGYGMLSRLKLLHKMTTLITIIGALTHDNDMYALWVNSSRTLSSILPSSRKAI